MDIEILSYNDCVLFCNSWDPFFVCHSSSKNGRDMQYLYVFRFSPILKASETFC